MSDRFVHRYLEGDPDALAFVGGTFEDPEARARAARQAAERRCASEVVETLSAQARALGASAARQRSLDALSEGAVAVVTGQQVGLFLGPLYTLYKAASAICIARALEAETGQRAVPLFWLQTEDHDFEEIATAYVPRTHEAPLALTAPDDGRDRVSVAHRRLGDIGRLQDDLQAELGDLPAAGEHLERLFSHYRSGADWSSAFAGLLAELFEPEGLLLLDPRDPRLADLVRPVHARALSRAEDIAAALLERVRALEAAGLSAPVHVREGAPLFFHHPDGPNGPRYRVVPEGHGFAYLGRDGGASRADLEADLEQDPLRFSTSALLRPVLQDALLPTAVYVGGPGEIDYFSQLAPLYAAYDLPMPLLAPRARFRVVEPKIRKALDDLSLDSGDAEQDEASLLAKVSEAPDDARTPDALRERLTGAFARALDALRPDLERLQDGLPKAAEKTQGAVDKAIGKLVDKYEAALSRADEDRVAAVRRLRGALFPMDAPQERVLCLSYFGARHGDRAFVERILEACEPWRAAPKDLEP